LRNGKIAVVKNGGVENAMRCDIVVPPRWCLLTARLAVTLTPTQCCHSLYNLSETLREVDAEDVAIPIASADHASV